jgi:hypothetical protein
MLRALQPATAAWLCVATSAFVCAQIPQGGPQSGAAKVIYLNGSVSILKDLERVPLYMGDWVRPQQQIVTGSDGFAVFEIASDGSRFEVFPNSRVMFRTNSTNWSDLLDLTLGRVKVYIQKLTGAQPNNNRIHTPTAVISVRGTVFDVVVDDDSSTLVSVDEGQVWVRHRLQPQAQDKILNAGESLRVYRNEPLAKQQVDKGSLIQKALRTVADVLYTAAYDPRIPGGGRTPTPTQTPAPAPKPVPGDTEAPAPPPPPPPPAAPPPPPQ